MQPVVKFGLIKAGIPSIHRSYMGLLLSESSEFWTLSNPRNRQNILTHGPLLEVNSIQRNPLGQPIHYKTERQERRAHIRKRLHSNSKMVTDKVMDTPGTEIHVRRPNQHLSSWTIISNTLHTWRLINDTLYVWRQLYLFRTTGDRLVLYVQGYFFHKQYK